MKKFLKNPLLFINIFLLALVVLLSVNINPNSNNLPSFAKKAIAAVSSILGEGSINHLAAFDGTNQIGNSIIYDTGSNIGIGTSAPLARLHLQSNAIYNTSMEDTSTFKMKASTDATAMVMGNTTTGFSYIQAYDQAETWSGKLILQGLGGNVGIGKTNPGYKLEVNGSIGGTYVGTSAQTYLYQDGLCLSGDCRSAWPENGGTTCPCGDCWRVVSYLNCRPEPNESHWGLRQCTPSGYSIVVPEVCPVGNRR